MTAVRVTELRLHGLKLVTPDVFGDDRGFFLETYSDKYYRENGIPELFQQDNHSRSVKGTVRGLHYQSHPGQAKLVRCSLGKIWDVAVDIRAGSETFGQWEAVTLDDEQKQQLYVPVGFAHGFCVLSDYADVQYKVSSPYDPKTEKGFRYNDSLLNIPWPIESPLLSARDMRALPFATWMETTL